MSCEQICGKHLRIDSINEDLRILFKKMAESNPNTYHLNCTNKFSVIGPNSNDITKTAGGKSQWILLNAKKSPRQQINILILGRVLWGLEISSGLRMKKSTEKYGKDKIAKYLVNQVNSILTEPNTWLEVQGYYR